VEECKALNEWLQAAPHAQAVSSLVGAEVNMSDFANRPAKAMATGDILQTGVKRYRFIHTPHLPHGWDAGVLFEERDKTLPCSDLFHHNGDVPALTDRDILSAHKASMFFYEAGSLMDYTPYNHRTKGLLYALAYLGPTTLATMHGSSFYGDCAQALGDLNEVLKEVWGERMLLPMMQMYPSELMRVAVIELVVKMPAFRSRKWAETVSYLVALTSMVQWPGFLVSPSVGMVSFT
jgi:flavorubredoxin